MKQGFLNLFGKRWKFQKSGLVESGADLKNPARGWYQAHTFLSEESYQTNELAWRCDGEDTLAYDYIGRHMGYRFCVRGVSVQFSRREEEACVFKVVIENTGFVRCYHATTVWLEWETTADTSKLDLDLSSILPGEKKTGSCTAIPVSGNLYLYAERKKDGAPIRFANESEDTRRILLGTCIQ